MSWNGLFRSSSSLWRDYRQEWMVSLVCGVIMSTTAAAAVVAVAGKPRRQDDKEWRMADVCEAQCIWWWLWWWWDALSWAMKWAQCTWVRISESSSASDWQQVKEGEHRECETRRKGAPGFRVLEERQRESQVKESGFTNEKQAEGGGEGTVC